MLKAVRDGLPFGEYDRLVLHHGQTALAFELSRRRAVSAAELRLAGDLLDDLEDDRLDEREAGRRMAAFGLDPRGRWTAALLALPTDGLNAEAVRQRLATELDALTLPYVSTARLDRAAFLVEAEQDEAVLGLAQRLAGESRSAGVGIGRPARGRELGRSLLEARAALDTTLGQRRLLPRPRLARAAPEPSGRAARGLRRPRAGACLGELVAARLARRAARARCRWSDAAERLGVHRTPSATAWNGCGSNRPPSRRSGAADGAVARAQGASGIGRAPGGAGLAKAEPRPGESRQRRPRVARAARGGGYLPRRLLPR